MIDKDGHNLAFVLGLPRSGTTLLSVLLDKHPQVLCPPEPWVMLALESFGKVSERHPANSGMLGQAVLEFCQDGTNPAAAAFVLSLYNSRLAAAGKSIFVDKTPRYYHIIPYLRQVFRESKWIWLQRDPFDVAASYKTSWNINLATVLGHDDEYPIWSFDLIIGLERLCRDVDVNDPRVLTVKYENLVARPDAEIARVMQFLDLTAQADQTQFDLAQSPYATSFGGDKKIAATHSPHTNSIGTWRSTFSKPELQTLLDYVGAETMRQLGYTQTLAALKEMGVVDSGPNLTAELRSRVDALCAERWADVLAGSRDGVSQRWIERIKGKIADQGQSIDSLTGQLSAAQHREQELAAELSQARLDAVRIAQDLKSTSEQLSASVQSGNALQQAADAQAESFKRERFLLQREVADQTEMVAYLRDRKFSATRLLKKFSALAQQAIVGFPHDRRRKVGELPTITVVTPVYNTVKYIRETIESVLGQNYPNLQYIIVDGASSDGTLEIINEYRDRASLVISEPDNGMYDAIAKGFEHATGEILCYLNGDDLFESGGLMRVGEYFRDHPETKVLYHEDTVNYDGWLFPNAAQPPKMDRQFVLGGHILFQDGVFFRRTAYARAGGVSRIMRRAGDWDLWVRLASVAKFVRAEPHQSCFRVVPGQLSGDMDAYNAEVAYSRQEWRRRFGQKGRPLERLGHLKNRIWNTLWRHLKRRRLFFPLATTGCQYGFRPTPGEAPTTHEPCRCPLTGEWPDRLLFSSKDTRFGDDLINRIWYSSKSDLAIVSPALTKERLNELYEKHYSNPDAKMIVPPIEFASPYKNYRGGGHLLKRMAKVKLAKYFAKASRWEDQTCEQLIENLSGLPRGGGPVEFLDVGCFDGRLLTEIAKRTDWKTCGLEPNSKAAEVSRQAGHQIWQGFAEDALFVVPPDRKFDVIHLGQTIEHLGDPLTVVRRLRSLLKVGGQMVLSTPNLDSKQIDLFGPTWSHWHPPYHRFLFSPKSLRLMAELAGLSVVHIRSYSHPYWTSMSVQLNRMGVAAAVPHTVTFDEDVVNEAMTIGFWSGILWNWRNKGDYLVAVFQKR